MALLVNVTMMAFFLKSVLEVQVVHREKEAARDCGSMFGSLTPVGGTAGILTLQGKVLCKGCQRGMSCLR